MTNEAQQNINFILGIKLGHAQIFGTKGEVIPVTIIKAGPCPIIQIKNKNKDGYEALQIGFLSKKKANKPLLGHIKKNLNQEKALKYIREFRLAKPLEVNAGQEIKINIFKVGDKVKITGTSKAKGFQGVVKRHNFRGASQTHGTKHATRQPGSIGATDANRVFKGRKMAGRMGGTTSTIMNLKIMKIDHDDNLLIVKGAVPGNVNGLLKITKTSK